MYNGNPFIRDTLTIHESHPLDAVIPSSVKAIEIRVDFAAGTRPRPADIATVLARVPADDIKLFAIDYDSQLREVPDLRRFTQVEYLHLAGRKLASPGDLSLLQQVHTLFLAGAKDSGLARMHPGPLQDLRLLRGNTQIVDVTVLRQAWLQNCRKLREFGAIELRKLKLESCHDVNLQTLARVKGLQELQLLGLRRLDDFSFLRDCHELGSLLVAGTLGAPRAPAPLTDSRLRELAAEFPRLLISNGNLCFRGHDPVDAW